MNPQDYFILWSIYCIAAVILLLASIFFTGFLWRFIKEPIVLVVAIILFSPTLIAPEQNQYAPAIAVMAMDFLMHVGEHDVSLASQLLYRIEVALAIYFFFAICIRWPVEYSFRKWWKKRQQNKQALQEHDDVSFVDDHL